MAPSSDHPDSPNFIHLAQAWTMSSTNAHPTSPPPTTEIETLKATHLSQIHALRTWHEAALADRHTQLSDLRESNHHLKTTTTRHARTIADREAQLFQLTQRGAPYSNMPCSLCGRVGETYAEDADERVAKLREYTPEEKQRVPPKPPPNGKTWLEGEGCYSLPTQSAPEYHRRRCKRDEARYRRAVGKGFCEEDLRWRTSDEEENGKGEGENGENGVDGDGSSEEEVDELGWPVKQTQEDAEGGEEASGW